MNFITIDFETANYARNSVGIIYNAHNALDDALTCGRLVLMSAEKHNCANVEELLGVKGMTMNRLGL